MDDIYNYPNSDKQQGIYILEIITIHQKIRLH